MSFNIKYFDKRECLDAVNKDGLNIRFCDFEMRKDDDVARTAIKKDGLALLYTPYEYCLTYDVAMDAVKSNGLAYFCLPETLRKDTSIALAAVNEYAYIYPYIDTNDIRCEALRLEAIKRNPSLIQEYFPRNEYSKDMYIGAVDYNHETYAIIARVLDKNKSDKVFATFWKNGEPYGIDYYDDIKEARKYIDREMRKLTSMEKERMDQLGGIDEYIDRRSYDYFVIDSERDDHPEKRKQYEIEDMVDKERIERERKEYFASRSTFGRFDSDITVDDLLK